MKILEFTVPGRPISLNGTYERRALGRGKGLRRTKEAEDFHARIQFAAMGALGHVRCPFTRDVVITVVPHFTRNADAGAVSKLVQDALEGLAYDNDRCVRFAGAWKGTVDAENPRTEVTIWEMSRQSQTLKVPIPARMTDPAAVPASESRIRPARHDYGKVG